MSPSMIALAARSGGSSFRKLLLHPGRRTITSTTWPSRHIFPVRVRKT
jgi:hypothetical protein